MRNAPEAHGAGTVGTHKEGRARADKVDACNLCSMPYTLMAKLQILELPDTKRAIGRTCARVSMTLRVRKGTYSMAMRTSDTA